MILFDNLFQTPWLIVNPWLHAAYIVCLYWLITYMPAIICFHSSQTLLKIYVLCTVVGVTV